jgi:beta-glucosidase
LTETADRSPAEIVAGLDLVTKVRLLSGRSLWHLEDVPEAGIVGIMVSDGPHGLRQQPQAGGDHLGVGGSVPATCFPTATALGSSWNETLLHDVGVALGEEATEQGVAVVLGPGLNIKRHPAGGRSFEYLSEDPLLSGKLAAALIRGVQSQGVGTSAKHFAVNNHEWHRLVVDAIVDERTLREIYLRAFEIVVTESQPETIMTSYNKVNGTYVGEHAELLDILRGEWGFAGALVSDWGAVNDRVRSIAAGLDLEMPGSKGAFDATVIAAVRSGELAESAVDRCAERVVALQLRHQQRGTPAGSDRAAHHQLARRAAAAGSVLLVNNGVLPLPAAGRIAVIGEFAAASRYQGAGSSQVNPTRVEHALDALRARVGEAATISYCAGYDAHSGEAGEAQISEAVSAATVADVAVLFVGLPAAWESEGFDRTTLDLPTGHLRLIEALAQLDTPVVVVLNNGGVVHLDWSGRVDAVLECWLGGQAGGAAVVDVLFGDAEPGGRLAESVPEHVTQLPAERNWGREPRQAEYREGFAVGYRFHDTAGVPARFPFGFGLSYTTFDWTDIRLDGTGTDVTVSLNVTNTGGRRGSDVVQVYVRDPESSVPRPRQELRGFAHVDLEPGATAPVSIRLDRRGFAVWDGAAGDWLVEAGEYEIVVARSSVDQVASLAHQVESADQVTAVPAPAGTVLTADEFATRLGRPIPVPAPVRPFHRNSTLAEIMTTKTGRLIGEGVLREAKRRAAVEFPDPDAATQKMIEQVMLEGPARLLVLMSGGAVTFDALDALLAAMNGEWSEAGRNAKSLLGGLFDKS